METQGLFRKRLGINWQEGNSWILISFGESSGRQFLDHDMRMSLVLQIEPMSEGYAPKVLPEQQLGGRISYELHHVEPISQGGSVYDVSNIMVTTPKFHNEVLLRSYHAGG